MCGQDRDLALRVDELLHTADNYDLIGDSYKEAIYYRNMLGLLCNTEPIEAFMENFYNQLVPNVYTPEPGIMEVGRDHVWEAESEHVFRGMDVEALC